MKFLFRHIWSFVFVSVVLSIFYYLYIRYNKKSVALADDSSLIIAYINKLNKYESRIDFIKNLESLVTPKKIISSGGGVSLGVNEEILRVENNSNFYLIVNSENLNIGNGEELVVFAISLYDVGEDKIENSNDKELIWWLNKEIRKCEFPQKQ
jgi:hypothetical protein